MKAKLIVTTDIDKNASFVLHDGTVTTEIPLGPEKSVYASIYGGEWRSHWILDLLRGKLLGLRITGVH